MFEVRALVHVGRAAEALDILSDLHVLPSEHARGTRQLYSDAHSMVALDAMDAGRHQLARDHLVLALEWPESLGEGRPYEPEERLVRLLLGLAEAELGDAPAAAANFRAVVEATRGDVAGVGSTSVLDLLAGPARIALGMAPAPAGASPPSGGEDIQTGLVARALALAGTR